MKYLNVNNNSDNDTRKSFIVVDPKPSINMCLKLNVNQIKRQNKKRIDIPCHNFLANN
jgi:hypothetical protein